ncbi:hypothetical protein ACFOWE_15825 [Planomonospora corallina]|uniref:Uncharacterized protein n=1 Tax=Planomonospora corallina TaxID=1806052 RepID=A0ABV8I6F5_9ACTN
MTPQSDEDEVWRQIVASFHETAERDPADQPWPDSENLPAEPARQVAGHSGEDGLPEPEDEPAGDGAEEEDEGHYVPPPPPPLPKTDAATKIAWIALFGGPAYLLVAAAAGWELRAWALFTAVAAFIGGFVALVVRMGDGPPGGSGWDDGAVL